jgi:hypothetical protein
MWGKVFSRKLLQQKNLSHFFGFQFHFEKYINKVFVLYFHIKIDEHMGRAN